MHRSPEAVIHVPRLLAGHAQQGEEFIARRKGHRCACFRGHTLGGTNAHRWCHKTIGEGPRLVVVLCVRRYLGACSRISAHAHPSLPQVDVEAIQLADLGMHRADGAQITA